MGSLNGAEGSDFTSWSEELRVGGRLRGRSQGPGVAPDSRAAAHPLDRNWQELPHVPLLTTWLPAQGWSEARCSGTPRRAQTTGGTQGVAGPRWPHATIGSHFAPIRGNHSKQTCVRPFGGLIFNILH